MLNVDALVLLEDCKSSKKLFKNASAILFPSLLVYHLKVYIFVKLKVWEPAYGALARCGKCGWHLMESRSAN
jgi:hypothetical protein